ncbi:MAG: DUF4131 domain-containing protein, partial [Anaerolineae bacterium]
MTLVYLVAAWIFGLFFVHTYTVGYWILVPAGFGLALLVASRRLRVLRIAGALFIAFALGGVRLILAQPVINAGQLAYYNGQQATVYGYVAADPVESAAKTQLQIRADRVEVNSENHPVSGQFML